MADALVIAGIPIPSTSPLFLGVLAAHVPVSLATLVSGAVAILSRKGRGQHSRFGTIYVWCLSGVFLTATVLSALRWAEDYHLFVLGALAFGSAWLGRIAMQRLRDRPELHVIGMGMSYIFLLTAFYVDNGRNLPLWRMLPQIAFWILPAAIGVPIIVYAIARHPVVRATAARR